MTNKEQLMAIYRKENTGNIPWGAYGIFLLPTGSNERYLRNNGCCWIHWTPVCSWLAPGMSHMAGWMLESEIKDVQMSLKFIWGGKGRVIRRTYDTPVGSVYEELCEEPGYHSLWVKKFLIEKPEDYKIVKFMVENTVFRVNYDAYIEADGNMGNDGVELAVVDRSPFQKMLLELTGTERLFFDLLEIPELVENLLTAMEKRQEEAFQIIANSPAEVIWMVDNVTGVITYPQVFEKYCVPFYNKVTDLLHANGKVLAVHFDGMMKPIKNLVARTDIDCVESFTLSAMGGDLTIEEAIEAWSDKSIIANIPASLCLKQEKEIRTYLHELLEKVASHRNFMLELSENFPPEQLRRVLPIVADVMKNQ
ncbi:MAG: Uroporphyrinogen-III decarboxylase [Parcubacteria group bacterium GW2011_GWA2_43_17]|nr:MAG: Uroporphyrinogen-III decarboxylase [Parcubacteria group bacterium GW2011_GWA2_43_17]OHB44919.1 MAG: hypothetical protein A2Y13_11175 [Planctomycetes bacterium GWC2_45_44]